MDNTYRALTAALLLLALAAATPAAEAAPIDVCVGDECHRVEAGPGDAHCTASGDGSGVRVECSGG